MTKFIEIYALQPLTVPFPKLTPEQLSGKAPLPPSAITKIEIPKNSPLEKSPKITYLYKKNNLFYDGIALSKDKKKLWITEMGNHPADWNGLALPPTWDSKEKRESFPQADGRILELDLEHLTESENIPREIIGSGLIVTPKQLIASGTHLYWCDREGMRIFRSNLDGTDITCLVQRGLYPQDMWDMRRHCVGVAVDETFLYWTQKGGNGKLEGTINRCALEIPKQRTASDRKDIHPLLHGLPEPIDLLIYNTWLFWTARGNAENGGSSINRARLTHQGAEDHKILFTGFKDPIGLDIDEASQNLFVGDLGGHLWQAPLEACLSEKASFSVITELGPITGLAVAQS